MLLDDTVSTSRQGSLQTTGWGYVRIFSSDGLVFQGAGWWVAGAEICGARKVSITATQHGLPACRLQCGPSVNI